MVNSFAGSVVSSEVSESRGASLEKTLTDYLDRNVQKREFQPITSVLTNRTVHTIDAMYTNFVPGWLFFARRADAQTGIVKVWHRVTRFEEAKDLKGLVDSDTTIQFFKMADHNFVGLPF